MNLTTARLLCYMALSTPMAAAFFMLPWLKNSPMTHSTAIIVIICCALVIMSALTYTTLKKLFAMEEVDYNQNKIDIIFSTLKYLDGNDPITYNSTDNIRLEDIEFDYFPTSNQNPTPGERPQL